MESTQKRCWARVQTGLRYFFLGLLITAVLSLLGLLSWSMILPLTMNGVIQSLLTILLLLGCLVGLSLFTLATLASWKVVQASLPSPEQMVEAALGKESGLR